MIIIQHGSFNTSDDVVIGTDGNRELPLLPSYNDDLEVSFYSVYHGRRLDHSEWRWMLGDYYIVPSMMVGLPTKIK